ncbi:hypothetical protein BDV38DRAFT_297137 [Aspergillus pseudotamarii]|uniref:Uncharacterized protein n=1 Tax=Aspergillus pseudotamarii TaxID=132259 RepID=A0A5N6SGD2_ASPPS|nr:uncharacterized protein BDV38DRAFT_297137 [Aspergillus pseudotamarii]KAE8132144.1 hypothetical protein BDV38DRAFT_297137 [Aspergillus pseudotamarii]
MACLSDMFLHVKIPPWLKQFCYNRCGSEDLTDWDDGGQGVNSHFGDGAVGYDGLQSGSSEYQARRPLTYDKGQPNLPVSTKGQQYGLVPKECNCSLTPKTQPIKPASPVSPAEEARAVITPTLRRDRPPSFMSSGEIIALPSPPPRLVLPPLPSKIYDVVDAEINFGISYFTAYHDFSVSERRILFSARIQQNPGEDYMISCPLIIGASHLAETSRISLQRKLDAAREWVPNSVWKLFRVEQSTSLMIYI